MVWFYPLERLFQGGRRDVSCETVTSRSRYADPVDRKSVV